MGCIKNIKSFLGIKGIKYEGPHDFKITQIGVHMVYDSDCFIVDRRCRLCGCRNRDNFATYNDLLHLGFTPEEIEQARSNQI